MPVTCAVLIGGTITFELVHRHHLEKQKLAQEAQASRVRAEQGDAEAEYDLARMYFKGQGVSQSYSEAFQWYRKAAGQNYAKAEYAVGYSYYHGYGVDGDFTEALRWLHLAADQKEPRAETGIGIAYEVGNGVTANPSEAASWYRLAANQGEAAAEYDLGRMYAYGYGVTKDRLEARKWMTKAAGQGYRPAKQMLGRSWPELSAVQKTQLIIPLIVGILFIVPSLGPKLEPGSRIRRTTRLVGLGLLFSDAVSLPSCAYGGILAPPPAVWAFALAKAFLWGAILPFLLRIVWRNSPKWTMWASGILFFALNGIALARGFKRLPTDEAVRLLLSLNAHVLGLGIASAMLLLRSKGGEADGPTGTDEVPGTQDGEPAHP